MQNQPETDEITIDFKKIYKIFQYRKLLIFKFFLSCILLFVILTFVLPKKYTTETNLYINSSNSTNLAELNPFAISDFSGSTGGFSSYLKGGSDLKNEIEILQSPLVIDEVIKENNLKHKKGPKKGHYISTDVFLKKNISISDLKGTNVICIRYKSFEPELSYNIVNSIINNYKKTKKLINLQKTDNDIEFLEKTYEKTEQELNTKLANLKLSDVKLYGNPSGFENYSIQSFYNTGLKNVLNKAANKSIDNKQYKIQIDRNIEKLKMVQQKLDWSELVSKMAQNTTNIIVLKAPVKKELFEYSEPKLIINIILGIILGVFVSITVVFWSELKDKKLTYSTLNENIVYNNDDLNELKLILISKSDNNFALINFSKQNLGFDKFNNVKSSAPGKIQEIINNLKSADKVILVGEIGKTSKKTYTQIKNLCKELNKEIYREILI